MRLSFSLSIFVFTTQDFTIKEKNGANLFISSKHFTSHFTIIYFKIKNPPTLHSTSKIQPTTSPTFVFSVFASVRKKWGYERKLLTVV
jgi:hypothetical protein